MNLNEPNAAQPTRLRRCVRTALLLIASSVLLTLSTAPFGQFYLAWIALVPWLIAVAESALVRRATAIGFAGGVLYFAMNLWWLWTATIPGMVALVIYFSLYWGLAAATIRALGFLSPARLLGDTADIDGSRVAAPLADRIGPVGCVFGVASIWVAMEWIRCYTVDGFFWMPIGATQSPLLVMCQVADLGGPWIVSFWVILINGLAVITWQNRRRMNSLLPAAITIAAAIAAVGVYGAARLVTTVPSRGPRVLLVQSNFHHLPGGALSAEPGEIISFLLGELDAQLSKHQADLAVLPEAAFPPINAEARAELARAPVGASLENTHRRLSEISAERRASLLVGGNAVTGWSNDGKARVGGEIRNSAYYFQHDSTELEQRYDKSHLVPFSERLPFVNGPAWLHRVALAIAAGRAAQPLAAGDAETTKPFTLSWSGSSDSERREIGFIAPICLEAIDPRVISKMMRRNADGHKAIMLIANLSNDGWFAVQEKHQHLQTIVFRSIEHRVPLVRSSNTGISGWIDSTGRLRETISPNTSGAITVQVDLDHRLTVYARIGDVFAGACVVLTALGIVVHVLMRRFKSTLLCSVENMHPENHHAIGDGP